MTMYNRKPNVTNAPKVNDEGSFNTGVRKMDSIHISLTSEESISDAIKAGITTPELLANVIDDAELIDGCLVLDPGEWHADDGNAEIVEQHESGEEAAQEYVDGGSWGDDDGTKWISVRVWLEGIDANGEIVRVAEESHTITVEPTEPECEKGYEHEWESPYELVGGLKENPSVFGHGGGVKIHTVCTHCGCERIEDTWAQNPNTGEQGLTSIEYIEAKYADRE